MIKSNSVDRIYKLRQLFPSVSEKVVYIGSKQERLAQKEREIEYQQEAA